ncbi:MAG: DUF4249 domain-containing protein [Bacteroidales bacterium]
MITKIKYTNSETFNNRLLKIKRLVLLLSLLFMVLIFKSCITQFIPESNEVEDLLVVEGLITNQNEKNTIKLSRSLPLGLKSEARPFWGCDVFIMDNLGNSYHLNETNLGVYVTDSSSFIGIPGRIYTLKIITNLPGHNKTYESYPVEMKPVPLVDSLFYEKNVIKPKDGNYPGIDGCQIYLNTHDQTDNCRYFRWDFEETWILRLLWPVENMKCWVSDRSNSIHIKSTLTMEQNVINRFPIHYISNETDRLKRKYSILVNQYSMSEEEFNYWQDLQNLSVKVGGLSDLVPYTVPGNIKCIEKPDEKVLGYFSVSAKSSKRIYIEDNFAGIIDDYADCPTDTIPTDRPENIPGFNVNIWALLINKGSFTSPAFTILTDRKGCADCTERGTTQKPSFWIGD